MRLRSHVRPRLVGVERETSAVRVDERLLLEPQRRRQCNSRRRRWCSNSCGSASAGRVVSTKVGVDTLTLLLLPKRRRRRFRRLVVVASPIDAPTTLMRDAVVLGSMVVMRA